MSKLYPCPCGCETVMFGDADAALVRRVVDLERLANLARCLRDAGLIAWGVSKGVLMSMQSALGLPQTWEPGHALPGKETP